MDSLIIEVIWDTFGSVVAQYNKSASQLFVLTKVKGEMLWRTLKLLIYGIKMPKAARICLHKTLPNFQMDRVTRHESNQFYKQNKVSAYIFSKGNHCCKSTKNEVQWVSSTGIAASYQTASKCSLIKINKLILHSTSHTKITL